MRMARIAIAVVSALILLAGATAAAVPGPHRIVAPGLFGFDEIAENVYAPPTMATADRAALVEKIEAAIAIIERAHNLTLQRPVILLCPATSCEKSFGAVTTRGIAYGSHALRLNAQGLNLTISTHELSHIALKQRVGDMSTYLGSIPAWFDEGLAVLLSQDDRFAASYPGRAKDYMRRTGSWRTWGTSTEDLGWKNAYGASRDLVRDLRNEIGMTGIVSILEDVASGADFETALSKRRQPAKQGRNPGTVP